MNTERDAHFIRAAELLKETLEDYGYIRKHREMGLLIAHFLYDFALHDRMNTPTIYLQRAGSSLEAQEMVQGIPDMTAWPES